ncbi:biopolymer transporter ExbD [Halochromatium glycolicum]|uniref:Biopolymer transporter ExbD n=1 Tax=Halochromatium glycolicum TaxID=85075 RepID=A0AAJ0U6W2_9GAMM|nr:hypothetical protein [Halochromatium glycolicum]
MNLRPHRPEAPEINLAPLIDVVFLLLIFFMVSTTFRDDGRLRLQLPEADTEAVPADEIELVEVVIDRHGRYDVAGRPVASGEVEALRQALVDALGAQRDLPVLIKADAQARHQAVMSVLDASAQLGLTRVAFAATQVDRAAANVVSGRARPDAMTDQGAAGQGMADQEEGTAGRAGSRASAEPVSVDREDETESSAAAPGRAE